MMVSPRTSRRMALGLLLVATLFAYVNAFTGAFQFDDTAVVLGDSHLADVAAFGAHLAHTIRPLVKLTFFIDRRLYGDQPTGYHLFNLLFHMGSGLLLYRLCRSAVRLGPSPHDQEHSAVPFWTALLFLLHPIGTEAVTYISGRPTGMMTFFYLAALVLYLRATPEEKTGRRFHWSYYSGGLLCFMLALLCKESAVTLPVTLLLWEVMIRRRSERVGPFIRRRLPLWLPFWGVLLLLVWAGWSNPRYAYLARYSLELRPLTDNLLTQINVVAYALSLFVWPARLTFDHDFPIAHSIVQWPTPVSLAILMGLLAIALLSVKRKPFVSLGLFWFFVTLTPTNSVIPRFDLLSERNLYLPSIGLFLAVATLLDGAAASMRARLTDRVRQSLVLIPVAVAALLIASTHARNMVYTDQVAFWTDAAAKSPGKARAHNNAGYAWYLEGEYDRAMEEFRAAVALNPDSDLARENLRLAWEARKGQFAHPGLDPAPVRMP